MEHVNGWCFRGIYKGGLWEDDLHVSALAHDTGDTSLKRSSCMHAKAIKLLFFKICQQMIHQNFQHAIN